MLKAYSRVFVFVFSAMPVILGAQERLLVSYAGFAGFQAPAWAAKDLGLFTKHGLTTELVMIPGSARGTQALLGGSTHFGQIDGTALIAAINQGADLVLLRLRLTNSPSAWWRKRISPSRQISSARKSVSSPLAAPTKFRWSWHSKNGTSRGNP